VLQFPEKVIKVNWGSTRTLENYFLVFAKEERNMGKTDETRVIPTLENISIL